MTGQSVKAQFDMRECLRKEIVSYGREFVEDILDDVRRWAAIGSRPAVVRTLPRIRSGPVPVLLLRCFPVFAGTAAIV